MNSEEIMHFTYVQFEAITPCTGFTYKLKIGIDS